MHHIKEYRLIDSYAAQGCHELMDASWGYFCFAQ